MSVKGKDLTVFVRFGGVNLKKQKGYCSDDKEVRFHSPPASRGIYSMPKVAQEFFLIGSIGSYQPSTMPKSPEYPSDRELTDDELTKFREVQAAFDWDAHDKRRRNNISAMRKEFVKIDGNIWHHLVEHCPVNEIISRHGSWVKTSIKTWQKAFSKMSLESRYGPKEFETKSINQARGIMGCYSLDHCEVFFDEKV